MDKNNDVLVSEFKKIVDNYLINQYSKKTFLSFEEVERNIVNFRKSIEYIVDSASGYLRVNSKERELNRAIIPSFYAKIISLGYDCLPRTVIPAGVLNPQESMGRLHIHLI